MYFGADYYPEHWVFPYGGSADKPEACWERDAELMANAGINVVRMGELSWGLCEREEGKYDFGWLQRAMDVMGKAGIKVVLGTPTAAPPLWLMKQHPEILLVNEQGLTMHEGTRRAVCLNADAYWDRAKKIVNAMAAALGKHPQLIAWQIDNALGGHFTEASFNNESRLEWQNWLKLKYETLERLNDLLGLRHWGQIAGAWDQVPMPMASTTAHNPALVMDWYRFCSDTIVAFVKMQADVLRELTPGRPLTTNLRALTHRFDHFDLAEILDFVSIESSAIIRNKSAESSCEIDMLRSLKKTGIRTPDGDSGFWVMEQKAGQVTWQEVNSLVRPGVLRLFTYQLVSRGATGVLYFRWRQPRIGTEKFHGAIMSHGARSDGRVYKEVSQIGEEMKILAPAIKNTRVTAEAAILYTHENDWALRLPNQPTKHFNLRDHIQLFYAALHDRNILVDFARPNEDLSKYKLVFAPSLHLLSAAEADHLKLYVQNGGLLVGTFNTGMVDEHHIAPDNGFPHDLTDLFGLEVTEFDTLPPGEENPLIFKGAFPTSHMHAARIWCDVIEPRGCQVLATYAKDFYSGKPVLTMNDFGLGKAVYIGAQLQQPFYNDLVIWLRQMCNLNPLLKVPENVEVGMRQNGEENIFFLLNHQNSPIHIQFYKPMHDYLTASSVVGGHDLPPHGVLVLNEHRDHKAPSPVTETPAAGTREAPEPEDTEEQEEEPA
jgi:beta-galactosidase